MCRGIFENNRGLSLLEMVTVVVIIGILITSSIFVMRSAGGYFRLRSATMRIRQDIALARQHAKERGLIYGVKFDQSGKWKVFYMDNADSVFENEYELDKDVRYGYGPGVTTHVGAGVGTPPTSGVEFSNDAVVFHSRGSTPGVLYLTNGKETNAIEVNVLGTTRVYKWENNDWELK